MDMHVVPKRNPGFTIMGQVRIDVTLGPDGKLYVSLSSHGPTVEEDKSLTEEQRNGINSILDDVKYFVAEKYLPGTADYFRTGGRL